MLGLPDECSDSAEDTVEERRAAVLAKLVGIGGQSPQYFLDVAADLGFEITIEELSPFLIGDLIGDPLYDEAWRFTWIVNASEFTIRSFLVGSSRIGEPLRTWGNEVLECVFARLKPAHTRIQHTYGSA